jgi:hypothetical protein
MDIFRDTGLRYRKEGAVRVMENIEAEKGDKVIYTGASDEQVRWGGCDDPRGILEEGKEYVINHTEIHSWHTKVYLEGMEDKRFPSSAFENV